MHNVHSGRRARRQRGRDPRGRPHLYRISEAERLTSETGGTSHRGAATVHRTDSTNSDGGIHQRQSYTYAFQHIR